MATVLIMDDDTDLMTAVKSFLTLKGYNVFTTSNPKTLEQKIEGLCPSLIIMDVNLDGADGRDLCRSLKLNEKLKNIPIILFSADHSVKKTVGMFGANDFIEKPFEARRLLNSIDNLINLHPMAKSA